MDNITYLIMKKDGIFFIFTNYFTTIVNKIISYYRLIQDSINGTFETKFTFFKLRKCHETIATIICC